VSASKQEMITFSKGTWRLSKNSAAFFPRKWRWPLNPRFSGDNCRMHYGDAIKENVFVFFLQITDSAVDRRQGAFFQSKDNDHLLEREILAADGFNGRLKDITVFFNDREYYQMIKVFRRRGEPWSL